MQLGLLRHFGRMPREGSIRAMHRSSWTGGVRLAVDEGRILRDLSGKRRHRKRRGALQGSPPRQETVASQSKSHLRFDQC